MKGLFSLHIINSYEFFSSYLMFLVMFEAILIESSPHLVLAGLHRSLQEAIQTVQAYGLLFCALPNILRSVW